MRFLITSVSGKKGYKSFKNLNEYVEFMTKKGHLVKDLKEADLPYTDRPVKLPKVSKSNGWSEVTDFGEVGEEAEKGESLIASTSKSVMKDEASFEMSKSSGKADKPEMGLGAEKGDIDMSDFKSFEYEEPKLKSSETKESTPKSEEFKSEGRSKEDKKDSNISSKKEEKKDESKKHDKDIAECLKAAGVQLNEFFHFDSDNSGEDDSNEHKTYKKYMNKEISDDEARSELKKQGYKGKKAKNLVKNAKSKRDSKLNEYFKFDSDNSGEDDSNEKFIEELRQEVHSLRSNSLFIRACVKALKKLGGNGGFGADRQSRQSIERFINEVNKLIRKYTSKSEYTASSSTLNGLCEFIDSLPYEQSSKIIDDLIQVVYNNCDSYAFNLICDEVAYASRYGRINESIKDYLPRAGVQLNEFFKFDASEYNNSWEEPMKTSSDRKYIKWDDRKFQKMCEKMGFDRFMKNCRRFFHQTGGSNTKGNFLSLVGDNKNIDEIIKIVKDNSDKYGYEMFVDFMRKQNGLPSLDSYDHKDNSELEEGIKDYLPRAGFIRDDDEDKDSGKMGIWGGQGTDDQLRKAKIIAKVKFANGDRMGRVTSKDLKHFDEYKAQYDEIYGSDEELDEGWKDKFKKGAATLGVAASLAGNAMANEPSNRYEFNDEDLKYQMMDANDCEFAKSARPEDFYKKIKDDNNTRIISKKDGYYVDQYGNKLGVVDDFEETEEEIEESDDDMLDVDIAECLKAAGVQLNEFFHFDGSYLDDESKESDDEKTYKKYMNKEISDDEARSELKKQGWKGKKAKNAVKNAKSKRDGK